MKNVASIRPTNHGRHRSTGGNTRLASCGVTSLNSSSVFHFNFSAGLTVLCSEIPHERQAWERYAQCSDRETRQIETEKLHTNK